MITRSSELRAALAWFETGEIGLAAVVDPFTGRPFGREVTANGFRLIAERPGRKPVVLVVGERPTGQVDDDLEPSAPSARF